MNNRIFNSLLMTAIAASALAVVWPDDEAYKSASMDAAIKEQGAAIKLAKVAAKICGGRAYELDGQEIVCSSKVASK